MLNYIYQIKQLLVSATPSPPPINDHNWRNVKRKKEVYGVGENYSLWFKKQSLGEKL